jgi:DNA invertase Pin-like site-specific DNA recombinase
MQVVVGASRRDALCRDAAQRKFDMVMAWSVGRLGRNFQDLVGFLSELRALRIALFHSLCGVRSVVFIIVSFPVAF